MTEAATSLIVPKPAKNAPILRLLPITFFLFVGGLLRAWMLRGVPQFSEGDSLVYGNIARNLLIRGIYSSASSGDVLQPTLIRLPGYPLFLALCFRVFGVENYMAVAWVQIVLELVGCLLLADFASRIVPLARRRFVFLVTLFFAAICPFTAVYTGAPLTETLTLFTIVLGLWSLVRFCELSVWKYALCFTFAVTYAALLRPDGALLAVALVPALLFKLRHADIPRRVSARILVTCILLAILPFCCWTWRNWRTFHVFQPLAPRYATDPGESTNPGWQRWMKTWCLDYNSTYEIYWDMPNARLDINSLPGRAFDSPVEYNNTAAIFNAYEQNNRTISPQIDASFNALAWQRIKAHPLRYYVFLPAGRLFDMWFRPRIENLPIDLDWWIYSDHNSETVFSWFYVALNAAWILIAGIGLILRPRFWQWMLLYFILRSLLLMTIEAPEARYTLECFPMIFALAGVAIANIQRTNMARAGGDCTSSGKFSA